jgi:hemoglobin-like flavoprotein
MDERHIQLVQQSFARAERFAPHLAATFYAELFALEPSLRAMFKNDMIAQGQKLMTMLRQVIANLDQPETILPTLRELAVRHVEYGVENRHYALVGAALLRALRHELGVDFTADTRAAWAAAYQMMVAAMREAAYGQARTA